MSEQTMFPPARTLSDLIRYLTDGFDLRCGEELQQLAQCQETLAGEGLKESTGEVTLTLKIKRGKDGVYELTPQFKIKQPRMPSTRTVLWVDRNNNFTMVNPRQLDMGFRQVGPVRRDTSDA